MLFSIPDGQVRTEEDGLYWQITADCRRAGSEAPRLYLDGQPLGLFVPEQGVWRFVRRVSRRRCRICLESRFSLAEDGWVYDPEAPLPQMARFTELVPELRNGTLYLRLPKTDAP